MQTPPAMAHEFDDTIHAHGDALARAFAESPPSAVGNPPARFRPGKHPLDTVVSVGNPHPVRVPEALEEAMRLQSLERFARRKETEARTLSPLRKAEVRESRARSVCGTGVAERKTLGSASKLKIDAIVRAGARRPETFGRASGAPGVRDCADSIQSAYHKSGRIERPGSALDFKRNDHDGDAMRALVDPTKADAVARAVGFEAVAALAPPAPALRADRGWSEAGNEDRPSMRAAREGHPSSNPAGECSSFRSPSERARLPSAALGSVAPSPASAAREASSAAARARDPRDSAREPPQRTDAAFDAYQLRALSVGEAAARSGKGEEGTSEGNEERLEKPPTDDAEDAFATEGETKKTSTRENAGDAPGVLEALLAAGPAVRALSLEERKEMFEVAVQEQVTALTHQLFPPEDGLVPRVHIDVTV